MLENRVHSLSVSPPPPTPRLSNCAITQCSVCCGCVMPPLMACEVSPFPNGLFCHLAQHWVTCRQRPSPPSRRFSPCPDQVAISWTSGVTAALTCISPGLRHCHFDQASTGPGRCQDRGSTDWPLSLQPDMARGRCWRLGEVLAELYSHCSLKPRQCQKSARCYWLPFFNSSAKIIALTLQTLPLYIKV